MDELAIYYFHQGTSNKAYELLGAHFSIVSTRFTIWAPNAKAVSVVGDFNLWKPDKNPMYKITNDGLWEVNIRGVKEYQCYQYCITTKDDRIIMKSDPYAFHSELRPKKASKVYNLDGYVFNDDEWMKNRLTNQGKNKPLNIYEMHLGSWIRYKDNNSYSYSDIAKDVVKYVKEMGYTHIELMPLSEYPYDPSWGYQVTGYFSVTSRYGTPKDFMYFVDYCHQNGIGVIMDWVPGHFTKDAHGLIEFDGEYLYEPSSAYRMEIRDWGTRCFDYGRCEIQSFLVSSALFWCDKFHIDGLRTDAVSSMLYLDYGRKDGEWIPNDFGNNYNLEAIAFIRKVNTSIKSFDPSILMIAEESTSFPKITHPISEGGLGFDYKWDMGWMNDTLNYIKTDPMFRGEHIHDISFQMSYIFSEQHILALSHDEVVHLKKSMIEKMPGEYDQKFSSLKSYYTYQLTHPGKKLLFMGGEFGQFREWSENRELDWSCLAYEKHQGLQRYVRCLNRLYKKEQAFYDDTTYWDGFNWNVVDDKEHSVFAYTRRTKDDKFLVILNFAYCEWYDYKIHCEPGTYKIILCSEDSEFGGNKELKGITITCDGVLNIHLPYSCGIILRKEIERNV